MPSVTEAPRLSDLRENGARVHAQHDPQSQSFFQRYGSNLPTSLTYMRHTLQRLITFETGCGNGYGHSLANTQVKCEHASAIPPRQNQTHVDAKHKALPYEKVWPNRCEGTLSMHFCCIPSATFSRITSSVRLLEGAEYSAIQGIALPPREVFSEL